MPLEDISPWMPLAVIASEDQRFLEHWGLDLDAIATAVDAFREGDSLRGASTITQQTAKNLFLWSGRSYFRKGMEAALALGLEGLWSKRRIMEVYLNVAEFGPGIYGVEAASRAHFGIKASQLTAEQAARLAAVLPNPRVYNAAAPSDYIWLRVSWFSPDVKFSGMGLLSFSVRVSWVGGLWCRLCRGAFRRSRAVPPRPRDRPRSS